MPVETYEVGTDMELVHLAQTGDKNAFNELAREHYHYAIHFLMAHGCSSEDADDIVQEALMKAWGHIGQMEGKAQFKTWFTSIVLHASQGFYRHEHHHREDVTLSSIECEDAVVSDKRAPLLEQLSANERRMELMAAIAELDEPHQSVIRLHYFEGMKFEEVATQLNAPVGTVRRHAKEAREQLFKILSQPA